MKNKELADLLLQNPENEVVVLIKGNWYLQEIKVKEITNNTSNNITGIVVNIKSFLLTMII